jgi:spermidine synthase
MSASKKLLVYLLFILSGSAGLVYQVIWVRVLQYSFGNTDLAVSTVIAVYMGGLALGAWGGGRVARRLRRPILAYGVLELAVAIYAIVVTPALYQMDFLYGLVSADAGVGTLTALRFVAATALLFLPTVCMGATLPVLTLPLVSMDRAGEGVGLLYFVNTLGAVLGSAVAGFALIRFLGLQTSLYIAAGIGAAVMLGAFLLQRGLPVREPDEPRKVKAAAAHRREAEGAGSVGESAAVAGAAAEGGLSSAAAPPAAAAAGTVAGDAEVEAEAGPEPAGEPEAGPEPAGEPEAGPEPAGEPEPEPAPGRRPAVLPGAPRPAAAPPPAGLDVLSPRAGVVAVMAFAALGGYVALVNEVVWTRILGFLLDGTVYGFSALLASFLLGIALGSLFISPFIDASRDLWGLLAKLQLMAALGCVFTILMIPLVPALVDAFLGSGTGVEGGFALKVCIVFLIILVPTLFFGASFPVCVTIAARYRGRIASSMGSVYAANTVGSILGSISGGIVLLMLVRNLNSILLGMVVLSLMLAFAAGGLSTWRHIQLVSTRGRGWRSLAWQKGIGLMAAPLAVLLLVAAFRPDVQLYRLVCTRYALEDYDRSLGFKVEKASKAVDRIIWKAQGRVTVVTVHRLSDGGLRLRNNGLNEAYHGTSEPRYAQVIWYLGVLPYMLHPKPERALQIGLGGGGTAECLTQTDLEKITVVELEPEVVRASKFIYRTLKVKHPSEDERVSIETDDGRNALLRMARAEPHHYDLIVSQPSHAWLSGVASLYTKEHFGIVRQNLRKGGVFCQWINLFRMDQEGLAALLKAFTLAFPSAHVWQVDSNSLLLVGGDEHLRLDPAVVRRHLQEPRLRKRADQFGVDQYAVFRHYLFGRDTAVALSQGARPNSDRYPIIEMRLPWVLHNDTVKIKKLLQRRGLRWGVRPGIFHPGEGWEAFLEGMAGDLITEFDAGQLPLSRVRPFVREAAAKLGVEGLMLEARLARLEGDVAAAQQRYRKAARAGREEAWFQLGSLYLTLEQYPEAVKACGRAYEKTGRADAHLCVAEAYFHQGRLAEAEVVLEALFQRKEQEAAPASHKWMGILHYRRGRLNKARERLEAYVDITAGDDQAPYYLGLMAAQRGDHYQARQYFATAVANARAIAQTASDRGKGFAKRGHQRAAVARFREAVSRQRDLTPAYEWMATALRRWGRFAEMERTLEMFERHDPTGAATYRARFRDSADLSERLGLVLHAYQEDLGSG